MIRAIFFASNDLVSDSVVTVQEQKRDLHKQQRLQPQLST